MGSLEPDRVTYWLEQWHNGAEGALDRLTPLIYDDLRRMAARYLSDEHDARTLQATALVHEVYLRMSSFQDIEWKSRTQFISLAARMMRRILIDHARKRRAAKRDRAEADAALQSVETPAFDVLVVDEALERMLASYPRHAQIVELRFFGGLDSPEIADTLGLSLRTVERDWRFAKAWLQNEMSP